jgi:hypothetical protein
VRTTRRPPCSNARPAAGHTGAGDGGRRRGRCRRGRARARPAPGASRAASQAGALQHCGRDQRSAHPPR